MRGNNGRKPIRPMLPFGPSMVLYWHELSQHCVRCQSLYKVLWSLTNGFLYNPSKHIKYQLMRREFKIYFPNILATLSNIEHKISLTLARFCLTNVIKMSLCLWSRSDKTYKTWNGCNAYHFNMLLYHIWFKKDLKPATREQKCPENWTTHLFYCRKKIRFSDIF